MIIIDQEACYLTVFDKSTVKYERRVYNIVMLFSSSHSRLVAGGMALPPSRTLVTQRKTTEWLRGGLTVSDQINPHLHLDKKS